MNMSLYSRFGVQGVIARGTARRLASGAVWRRGIVALAAAVALAAPCANAFVLNWATLDWTAGATNQTYANVNGSGITIVVDMGFKPGWDDANYQAPWQSASWPDDVAPQTGENSNVVWQAMNAFANTNRYVSVLFTFYKDGTTDLASISNITLKVEDVDSIISTFGSSYRDQIRNIEARDPTGVTTLYATGASYAGDGDPQTYTITGSGATLRITANSNVESVGADTGGDVNINFSTQVVSKIYYRYGNGAMGTDNSPTTQWTGPGLMNFEVVPEPSAFTLGLLGFAGVLRLVQRSRNRKAPPAA